MSTTQRTTMPQLPFDRHLVGHLDSVMFTGALTPHDLTTGRLVRSTADVPNGATADAKYGAMFLDIPGDAALAQAWQIYTNLSTVLEAEGLPTSDLCRQRLLVRDLRDVPLIERVMDQFIDAETVATTIVQIGGDDLDDSIRVQLEGAAVREGEKEVYRSPELDMVTGRYPAMVRAGQFGFVSALPGINPETGVPATGIDELGENVDLFDPSPYRSSLQKAILAQTWFTFQHLRSTLELSDATLGDVLKVTGWLNFPMRDFDPMRPVRAHLFSEPRWKTASTALTVGPNTTEGAVHAFDAIALINDPHGRGKEVRTDPSLIVPYYVGATSGGGAAFTCGEVPIDEDVPRAINQPEELDGSDRLIRFGRLDIPTGIEARAAYVYEKLEGHLRHYGSSLDKVVYQVVYLEDMREIAGLELVSRSVFPDGVPATTTVPIGETSPFWQESRLEIEVIATT
ncbi:MAG: hypothetical protein GEU79_06840 [Acidimicrobiia bacterium]|nr:hypothetical protein [Acidimicrobiia bacterium]